MVSQGEMQAQLRKTLQALPEGTCGDYTIRPPNKPLKLYSGIFELHQGRVKVKLRGTVEQQWYPYPRVRFSGRPTGSHVPELGEAKLRIPKCFTTAPVHITETTIGTRPRASGSAIGTVRLGQRRAVRGIRFHLSNFHNYVGSNVKFSTEGRVSYSAGRLTLAADGWKIVIDQSPGSANLQKLLTARGGYGVGHAGLITRDDGSRFNVAEASDIWSTLHFFLSFARGLWCGPIIATGVGQKDTLWTEWESWRISDWKGVSSWLPKNDPSGLNHAFSTFRRLWNRSIWNGPLRELVHWYVEANLNSGALEGSLVLGHTALELLAWMHVVVDKRLASTGQFDGLSSARRLERALNSLKIPIAIPVDLAGVTKLAVSRRLKSGPQVICKIRNALVHPTPTNRKFLAKASKHDRYELVQLCLWYLELGILAVLDYQGDYVTRLKAEVSMAEATTKVPWI